MSDSSYTVIRASYYPWSGCQYFYEWISLIPDLNFQNFISNIFWSISIRLLTCGCWMVGTLVSFPRLLFIIEKQLFDIWIPFSKFDQMTKWSTDPDWGLTIPPSEAVILYCFNDEKWNLHYFNYLELFCSDCVRSNEISITGFHRFNSPTLLDGNCPHMSFPMFVKLVFLPLFT